MKTIQSLLDPDATLPPLVIRPHRAGDMGWIVESQAKFYAEEYGWDMRFEGLVAEVLGASSAISIRRWTIAGSPSAAASTSAPS